MDKKKLFFLFFVIVLLVFVFGKGELWIGSGGLQSFVGGGDMFVFTVTEDSSNVYDLFGVEFKHVSALPCVQSQACVIKFVYGGKMFELNSGESVRLNGLLSVKPIMIGSADVEGWKVNYVFELEDVDVLDVGVEDSFQKLIGGDFTKMTICNSVGFDLPGGMRIVERYDNGKSVISEERFSIISGCESYDIPIESKYFNGVDIEFFPFITVNEIVEGPVIEEEGADADDNKLYTVISRERIFYDSNSYGVRYGVVEEVKEFRGVDCTTSDCPFGFSCDSAVVNGVEYSVCNKLSLNDVFELSNQIRVGEADDVTEQDIKGGFSPVLAVLVLFVVLGGFFIWRRKR